MYPKITHLVKIRLVDEAEIQSQIKQWIKLEFQQDIIGEKLIREKAVG